MRCSVLRGRASRYQPEVESDPTFPDIHQQGEKDPQAQPEPAYAFDQRIAW